MKRINKLRKTTILFFCVCMMLFTTSCSNDSVNDNDIEKNTEYTATNVQYVGKLFDTSYVHKIDITLSKDDLADLLENPLDKTKYHANITIDGETINDVSFATKGNTSLTQVASDSESNRYSFKINFGKYNDNQTYYGLDKLNLNNIYADATYMKDYISYEIFRAIDADAPLTSYVYITINGEEYGLYLAIEDVGNAFLGRTKNGEGELYKPETEQLNNMGNGQKGEMPEPPANGEVPQMPEGGFGNNGEVPQMPEGGFGNNGEAPQMPEGGFGNNGEAPQMPEGGFGNNKPGAMEFGNSNNGASLKYTDDSISSYSDIFDNAETKVTEEDMQRVIASLKQLSTGENLDKCLDIDSIIKYFVAHNFVMNYDSYTGNMLHNYYLYENNGLLSMIPWDYNLAFGAFSVGLGKGNDKISENDNNATIIVNYGIDSPLSGTSEEDRPMWAWIVNNEEYMKLYHKYYNELITNYFESGNCISEINRVYNMILPYVEKDSTAFYNSDEFKVAYTTLSDFVQLRAQSIRKQLDGLLATKTLEQSEENRIDASNIVINTMGTQNNGGHNGMNKW